MSLAKKKQVLSTVTTNDQTTISVDVCRFLDLQQGDHLVYEIN